MSTKITNRVIGMENPDKARKELEEILSQKEYQAYYDESQNIVQEWWSKFKRWFQDVLSDLFSDFEPSNGLADTLLVVMIGAIILLAIVVGFIVIRSIKRKRSLQRHQPFQSTNEMEWSVAEHLKKAERYENEGHYSLATRHQFLALLLHFHEENWLEAHVWKTNWDYVNELQQTDQQRAEAFNELARTFDEAFYGKRKIKHQEYTDYRKKVNQWLGQNEKHAIQEV